jgi:hypothetical protein
MNRQEAIDRAVSRIRHGWAYTMGHVAKHGRSPEGSGDACVERDMRNSIRVEFREIMGSG